MNDQYFAPGEIVDVTIKGATVCDTTGSSPPNIHFTVETGLNVSWSMPLNHDAITVTRLAPPEWPPRQGDLWRDKHGDLWFTHTVQPLASGLRMVTADGLRWSEGHEGQLTDNSPWTLVHRESKDGAP